MPVVLAGSGHEGGRRPWLRCSRHRSTLCIPSLAAGARRLHDTGKSALWLLIGLIPLLGLIVLIVFWAQAGNPSSNEYGAPTA